PSIPKFALSPISKSCEFRNRDTSALNDTFSADSPGKATGARAICTFLSVGHRPTGGFPARVDRLVARIPTMRKVHIFMVQCTNTKENQLVIPCKPFVEA